MPVEHGNTRDDANCLHDGLDDFRAAGIRKIGDAFDQGSGHKNLAGKVLAMTLPE
jgi:hypothetical protein